MKSQTLFVTVQKTGPIELMKRWRHCPWQKRANVEMVQSRRDITNFSSLVFGIDFGTHVGPASHRLLLSRGTACGSRSVAGLRGVSAVGAGPPAWALGSPPRPLSDPAIMMPWEAYSAKK